MASSRITYIDVADCLAEAGTGLDAAEVHGIATGLLSSGSEASAFFFEAVAASGQTDACRRLLSDLVEQTDAELGGASFGFPPLLPPDDAPLATRTAALRDWCEGFLYGIGLARRPAGELPSAVTEALSDIAELTRMDVQGVGRSEAEEQALTELVEFLRVAAMLIREELGTPRTPSS